MPTGAAPGPRQPRTWPGAWWPDPLLTVAKVALFITVYYCRCVVCLGRGSRLAPLLGAYIIASECYSFGMSFGVDLL